LIILTLGNLCLGNVLTLGLGILIEGVRKVIVEVVTELPDKNKDKNVLCNKIYLEQNQFLQLYITVTRR
jgi:hypothetical protein